MSVLVGRVRKRADLEWNDHVDDDEFKALISEGYGEHIYEPVAEVSRYFESSFTITATGATSYDEPSDWLQTMRFERVDGNGRQALIPLMPDERDLFVGTTGDALRYERIDDQIYLYPNPTSGSYRMLYKPQSPDLSSYADADLVDVVNAAGEAALIWGVAAVAKGKSESANQFELDQAEKAKERMLVLVAQESMSEAPRRGMPDYSHLEDSADGYWRYRP